MKSGQWKSIFNPYNVALILFVLPFMWLKPGEMDLGGDSSRLYFYNPLQYLKTFSLFGTYAQGMENVEPNYYAIPFFIFLNFLLKLFVSPYLVISFINGIILAGSFLAIYWIIFELSVNSDKSEKNTAIRNIAGICSGLFYVLTETMTGNWNRAILSHSQILINPLMFFLFYKYLKNGSIFYLTILMIFTLLFSVNFGLTSAPALLSFFPLALLYLLLVLSVSNHIKIGEWFRKINYAVFLFAGLHAYQIIPQMMTLVDPGSFSNMRVFDTVSIYNEGVAYFSSILQYASVSKKMLLMSIENLRIFPSYFFLFISILPFYLKRNISKVFVLTGIFYLLTLFLLTAKISNIGVEIYKSLFYIPGFSVFRNFIGQWLFVYSFFYALLFGQSLLILLPHMRRFVKILFVSVCIMTLVVGAWPFIRGDLVKFHTRYSPGATVPITMDPHLVNTLEVLRDLPGEGKVLTLPLTDYYYQVFTGSNNGTYIGLSTVTFLAGRPDFAGYQVLRSDFAEAFIRSVYQGEIDTARNILALLNIHYIVFNDDTKIFGPAGTEWLYGHVSGFLPKTHDGYRTLINKLAETKIYSDGHYSIYKIAEKSTLPKIYTASGIYLEPVNGNPSLIASDSALARNIRSVYLPEYSCKIMTEKGAMCNGSALEFSETPTLKVRKINPVTYNVRVENADNPYMLVLLTGYNAAWKVYVNDNSEHTLYEKLKKSASYAGVSEYIPKNVLFDDTLPNRLFDKPISDEMHVKVNGYANGWYISPSDLGGRTSYELTVEMTSQRYFYAASLISIGFLVWYIVWMGSNILGYFGRKSI